MQVCVTVKPPAAASVSELCRIILEHRLYRLTLVQEQIWTPQSISSVSLLHSLADQRQVWHEEHRGQPVCMGARPFPFFLAVW